MTSHAVLCQFADDEEKMDKHVNFLKMESSTRECRSEEGEKKVSFYEFILEMFCAIFLYNKGIWKIHFKLNIVLIFGLHIYLLIIIF